MYLAIRFVGLGAELKLCLKEVKQNWAGCLDNAMVVGNMKACRRPWSAAVFDAHALREFVMAFS
jgi:hypothetical protein